MSEPPQVPGYPPPPKTLLGKLWRATYAGALAAGACLLVLTLRGGGSWQSKFLTSAELGAAAFVIGLLLVFVIPLLPDKPSAAPPRDWRKINPLILSAIITVPLGLAPALVILTKPELAAQRGDPRAWAAVLVGLVVFWLFMSAALALVNFIKRSGGRP